MKKELVAATAVCGLALSGPTKSASAQYQGFGGANTAEIQWCLVPSHFNLCTHASQAKTQAENALSWTFPSSESGDGYKGNAFLHSYWHAVMVHRMNGSMAQALGFGDRHEDYPGNDINHKTMDLHNNWLGALVGSDTYGNNQVNAYPMLRDRAQNAFYSGVPISGPWDRLWYWKK